MRLLVLGGTSWLGGAVAAAGVAAGHEVTCLARGASGSVPAGATLVPANRGSLSAYDELGHFDAAIEVSWQPSFVAGALQHVRADHWVYVSSVSVYSDRASVAHGTVGKLLPEWSGTGTATREVYGEAKVACEKAYERALPASSYAVARAGLIGGYGDLTDRLGYWPGRVALAEGARRRVLVPAPTSTSVQVIDVLDLAAWLLHCATAQRQRRVRRGGPPHHAAGRARCLGGCGRHLPRARPGGRRPAHRGWGEPVDGPGLAAAVGACPRRLHVTQRGRGRGRRAAAAPGCGDRGRRSALGTRAGPYPRAQLRTLPERSRTRCSGAVTICGFVDKPTCRFVKVSLSRPVDVGTSGPSARRSAPGRGSRRTRWRSCPCCGRGRP